jgi:arylsulfatase A-like enzyme
MKRLLLIACLCAFVLAPVPAMAVPPNVIIVLVDDAGYGDFGCHGHPFIKTPNIDRLHGESVRLTDFHVAPMCTPTRGQLLTGMDALRNGAASVTAGRAFLRQGISTLPEQLVKAGYHTGIFGKWHLGDSYPHRPMEKGFQTAMWVKGWGFTSAPEFSNTLIDGRCYRGAEESIFKGYITDVCFDEALKWMKQRGEANEPFFCYVPLHAAHAPHTVPEKYSAPYADKKAAGFFGMLANIDENMGRLETFLRDSKLRDNTIVIFFTDNGGTAGVPAFNAGLRGKKTEYYDGGHRVPCFVRWPAGGWKARDISTPTQVQDIMPTLLEFCGATGDNTKRDGVSLAALLKNDTPPADRMLVVQFGASPPFPNDPVKGRSCVIWNQWRLVLGTELYDVTAERAQERDLAKEKPDVLAKMHDYYEKWWAGIEPGLHDFVTLTVGAPEENPVELTSSDWQDVYADNSNHIRTAAGGPRGGPWNINVARAGKYEITLRRWPFDQDDAALTGNVTPPGKALPIRAALIEVGDLKQKAKVVIGDKQATFQVDLPAGPTQLRAWFQDGSGADLCGAFFVKVASRE